jgi:rubrerythrin
MSRLIDADALDEVKYHPLPYTHITPSDVDTESYKRGWNDAIDAIMTEEPTAIEPARKTGKWIVHYECPKCGEITKNFMEYCPFCGADMTED